MIDKFYSCCFLLQLTHDGDCSAFILETIEKKMTSFNIELTM